MTKNIDLRVAWYLVCLTSVLTIFKLMGAIQWSWLAVVSPILIPIILMGVTVYVIFIIMYLHKSRWWYRLTNEPSVFKKEPDDEGDL